MRGCLCHAAGTSRLMLGSFHPLATSVSLSLPAPLSLPPPAARHGRLGRGRGPRLPDQHARDAQADWPAADGRGLVPLAPRLWLLALGRGHEHADELRAAQRQGRGRRGGPRAVRQGAAFSLSPFFLLFSSPLSILPPPSPHPLSTPLRSHLTPPNPLTP